MKVAAIIPARLQASRFDRKLLRDLCGKPVILRTLEAVEKTDLFDEVIVATDSDEIYQVVVDSGSRAFKSIEDHDCGSNRIAEVAATIDADIVINVQGDEPFTNSSDLEKLIAVFRKDTAGLISLASLKHQIKSDEDVSNPNNVKVITDQYDNAIYFSRSPIPFVRDKSINLPIFKHVGIYAFRKAALLEFYHSQPTPLELTEKIECIRYLEQGKKIKMVRTENASIGIDTAGDLEDARVLWKELYS
ncbi:MAG: 3-deoxy-manno-octulosonate cytidylyltransferase [Nonlabens sp.]